MALIIQPAFPTYTAPLFNRMFNDIQNVEFVEIKRNDLTAIESTENEFPIHVLKFNDFKWITNVFVLFCLILKHNKIVVFGNLNIWQVWLIIVSTKILCRKLILWTQVREKVNFNIKNILKRLVLKLSDCILVYTDVEMENLPISARKKSISLNNGLDCELIAKYRQKYQKRPNRFFSIGRNTDKSKFDWLISAFEKTNFELHIIGVSEQEIRSCQPNIFFHGVITREEDIAKIANSCAGFVYGGNVGLSLIHAMAYGLPPIVHSGLEKHMPEIAAFQELSSRYTFREDDNNDLLRVLTNFTMADNCKISEESISIVEERFNISEMYKRFKGGLNC